MSRLGTLAAAEDIVATVRETAHARLEGLLTHLASAGDYTSHQTDQQLRYFDRICHELRAAGFAPKYVHAANSSALGYGQSDRRHNIARIGHALYGYLAPSCGVAPCPRFQVEPALTWKARVVGVKDIPGGALVGYGGTFQAPRAMRIAVLGVGYADGLSLGLSNRGHVIAGGRLVPILGRISMDLTTIDLSETPGLAAGDEVTLLGSEGQTRLDAQTMAQAAGTISYDVLCGIGARVKRIYTQDSAE